MIALGQRPEGVVITLKVQPCARKTAVLGERAGSLRLAVSAAPEKGKANDAVRDLLADVLGLRTSQLEILTGATSRDKTFLIIGTPLDEIQGRIEALLLGLSG